MAKPKKKCRFCGAEIEMVEQPQGPPLPYCTPDCPGSYTKEKKNG